MNSELSNLALFFGVIGKVAFTTGLLPFGVIVAIFVKCPSAFCIRREWHDGDHEERNVRRVPVEPFSQSSSGDGQLAEFIPASTSATSPSRIRRSA